MPILLMLHRYKRVLQLTLWCREMAERPQWFTYVDIARMIFEGFFTLVVVSTLMYRLYLWLKEKGIIKE